MHCQDLDGVNGSSQPMVAKSRIGLRGSSRASCLRAPARLWDASIFGRPARRRGAGLGTFYPMGEDWVGAGTFPLGSAASIRRKAHARGASRNENSTSLFAREAAPKRHANFSDIALGI